MDEAGAVEQDVERPEFVGERGDRRARRSTSSRRVAISASARSASLLLGDVGGEHAGALGGEGERRRAADPLRRRRHQRALAFEPSRHDARSAQSRRQIATPRAPL